MIRKLAVALLLSCSVAGAVAADAPDVRLGSQSVLVVEDGTGKVLVEKNSTAIVPIASLTKLMTAMVVLDAKLDMNEQISIDQQDVDMLKHSTSRVPVGASLSRAEVLQLALMSSDNRAAASLARTFPGGPAAFKAAVDRKIRALGMAQTRIDEPTGLSPANTSTAADLVKMATAAAAYPDITRITTDTREVINVKGRSVEYHNTNRLVGAKGWDIGLSKTGYTEEAGRCLIMRIKAAGKNATMVLLNARANSARIMDALNIRRFITGDEGRATTTRVARAAPESLIKASAGRMKASKVSNNGRKKAAPSKKPRRRRAD